MNVFFRKSLFFLTYFCFIAWRQVSAQGYEIEMNYSDNNTPAMKVNLVWNINPTKCKLQIKTKFEGKNVASFFYPDVANGLLKMYEANPENGKKIFYTVNVSSLQPDARFDYKRGKVNLTNDVQTIAGVSCKKVTFTTDKFVSEFWLAESLPDVKPWASFFQSYPELNAIAEAGLSGFPLSSTIKDLSGKVLVSYQVTSVNARNFSDAEFLVPADYIDAASLQRK